MEDKKNEYRFTIQFDPTIPEHKQAAGILNGKGKKKAEYIARAIAYYEGLVTLPATTAQNNTTPSAVPPPQKIETAAVQNSLNAFRRK